MERNGLNLGLVSFEGFYGGRSSRDQDIRGENMNEPPFRMGSLCDNQKVLRAHNVVLL